MRRFAHNTNIRGKRDLATAAQAVAVDRSNDRHRQRLQTRHQILHPARHRDRRIMSLEPFEILQIAAGNENPIARPGKHDRADLRFCFEPLQHAVQLRHRNETYRVVDGGPVDCD